VAAFEKRLLGVTGLVVGPLGVAASYGAPAQAFEEAFDKGCNYFYLGSGRHRAGMKRAIRNLCRRGQREKLVIAIQSYARCGLLMDKILKISLRSMGLEQADIFILGWHNRRAQSPAIRKACRTGAGDEGKRLVSLFGNVWAQPQPVSSNGRRWKIRPVSHPL